VCGKCTHVFLILMPSSEPSGVGFYSEVSKKPNYFLEKIYFSQKMGVKTTQIR
jgi:hypothetical protein